MLLSGPSTIPEEEKNYPSPKPLHPKQCRKALSLLKMDTRLLSHSVMRTNPMVVV